MARTSTLPLAVLLSLVAGPLAGPLAAQERSLHWRSIAVEGRLDRDGVLHVTETQAIVYSGDWNGGERRFTVNSGQRFEFEGIVRVDSATGGDVTMVGGDLDRVDGFDFEGSRTVRWRSRLPDDPPFDNTGRTYRLAYSYANILVPDGDGFRLDHDFAFGDRDGPVEAFTLNLTLDPAWEAQPDFTGRFGPERLEPGYGFVVNLALRYLPEGRPAGVVFGAGSTERQGLIAAVLVGVLLLGVRFYRREASLGRFAPDVPLDVVTDDWLQRRVIAHRPEVIGAAWDEETGAAEVTAVLARLEAEGKLKSRVESRKVLMFSQHELHMELLVERDAFQSYERALIDALFSGASTKTDTSAIRKRYAKRGFTPSTKIESSVKSLVNRMVPNDVPPPRPGKGLTVTLLAAAVALFIVAGVTRPSDLALAGVGSLVAGGAYLATLLAAKLWQRVVQRPRRHALWFVVPLLAMVIAYVHLVRESSPRAGVLVLAGLAALLLAAVSSVLAMAMWRHGTQRLELRRELAAARNFFIRELQGTEPKLRDEWFPYLIAFGLGSHMDHWFKAFGGTARSATMAGGSSAWRSTASGGGDGGAGGWSGLGGGGGFAGGGSSGAWVAAASSVAAGVSAPSSSSSGGGGSSSGGSSSGGGGGGGW